MPPNPNRRRCTATTKTGAPCRAWAVRNPSPDGPEQPLCAAHARLTTGAGAPPGNQNRRTHGAYAAQYHDPPSLAQLTPKNCPPAELVPIIEDLMLQYVRLSRLIDHTLHHLDGHTLDEAMKLIALHAQTASRLGRLLQLAPGEDAPADFLEDASPEELVGRQMEIAARLVELGLLPFDTEQEGERNGAP
jgi:hypothetical protein